jgi:hypothetical protein
MFLGAARSHQCPLHQPGPLHAGQVTTAPHTHAPARPTPCKCRRCPTPILVPCSPNATASPQGNDTHSTALLPPPLDSAAEPPDAVAPPRSYRPLPTLPTHRQQFAGNVGAQVGHGSSGGKATFTRAAALRPPPLRGAGLFTLLISI